MEPRRSSSQEPSSNRRLVRPSAAAAARATDNQVRPPSERRRARPPAGPRSGTVRATVRTPSLAVSYRPATTWSERSRLPVTPRMIASVVAYAFPFTDPRAPGRYAPRRVLHDQALDADFSRPSNQACAGVRPAAALERRQTTCLREETTDAKLRAYLRIFVREDSAQGRQWRSGPVGVRRPAPP